MKLKCIRTYWAPESNEYLIELSNYITLNKIYETAGKPANNYVYSIIDDRGRYNDIGKECFRPLNEIRNEIIKELLK